MLNNVDLGGVILRLVKTVTRINVKRHFFTERIGILKYGIVCHLPSLILEVCHPSRKLPITPM